MRLRTGTVIAFGAGFLLGTRAGRERYNDLVRVASWVRRSPPVSGTTTLIGDKSKAVAILGAERARDAIGTRMGWRDGDEAADALAVDLASAINGRSR